MMPPPLPDPSNTALFLDVDGTLLELAARPESVRVSDELRGLLSRLASRLDGALALISGRSLDVLDELFAPLVLPAAGVHGLQRRSHRGQRQLAEVRPDWHAAVAATLTEFAATHPGLQLEDKGHALALHFRNAPEQAAAAETMADELLAELGRPTRLLRGKMVLEFMPAGSDKGIAIREFMTEAPFRDRRPVFIGDDVTDEAGFCAVNSLDGWSVRVGSGTDTSARHMLADVTAVYQWLDSWTRWERES